VIRAVGERRRLATAAAAITAPQAPTHQPTKRLLPSVLGLTQADLVRDTWALLDTLP
jgi:hypothetical protein